MDANLAARLIDMLRITAKKRGVLPYPRFHALFPGTTMLVARNAILNEALRSICDEQDADYSVLLARDNGRRVPISSGDIGPTGVSNTPNWWATLDTTMQR